MHLNAVQFIIHGDRMQTDFFKANDNSFQILGSVKAGPLLNGVYSILIVKQ